MKQISRTVWLVGSGWTRGRVTSQHGGVNCSENCRSSSKKLRECPSPLSTHRLIRPGWAKNSRHSLELNLLLPSFLSLGLDLTQPAGLVSPHAPQYRQHVLLWSGCGGELVQLSKKPHSLPIYVLFINLFLHHSANCFDIKCLTDEHQLTMVR